MKHRILILALLALFLLPLLSGPSMPATVQSQVQPETITVPAVDGAESPQSIPYFNETLPDNVLFYPDTFRNLTANFAVSSTEIYGSLTGDYADTHAKDGSDYLMDNNSIGDTETTVEGYLSIQVPVGDFTLEGISVAVYAKYTPSGQYPPTTTVSNILGLYDHDSTTYDDFGNFAGAYGWVNFTTYDPDYFSDTIRLYYYLDVTSGGGAIPYTRIILQIDYLEVTAYVMHLADSDHRAEGFCDLSDYSLRTATGLGAGEYGFGTDGDVGELWLTPNDSGDEAVNYKVIFPTHLSKNCYIEYRSYLEDSTKLSFSFYVIDSDEVTLRYVAGTFGSMTTYNTWFGDYPGLTEISGVVLSITDNPNSVASGNYSFFIDYWRIWEADQYEGGWQHDGSTVEGVTNNTVAGATMTKSTDGANLTLRVEYSGATVVNPYFVINFDTTGTQSDVRSGYYPFVEMCYKITKSATVSDGHASLRWYSTGYYTGITSTTTPVAFVYDQWDTLRFNHRAQTSSTSTVGFRFYTSVNEATDWLQLEVAYMKAYSVANWTETQSGCEIDDTAYVSDGVLYADIDQTTANEYIRFNNDPALSVDAATYNVFNVTTNQNNEGFYFYWNNGGNNWETESRGDLTGTVVDVYLQADSKDGNTGIRSFSAIRFIEDGTAPEVVFSDHSPGNPSSASTVTLSAVVTDSLEVYKVWFDAISYPSGFSDVPYYATEMATNLWTYSFASALPEGFYCFATYATDGANTNTPDYYAYVTFTVEVSSLTCYIRVFDSLGQFVPFETFEVYRNGTQQYTDTFKGYSDEAYQISVKDRWGETLNTTTFPAGTEELVVVVNIISLKVMSWHEDFVFFNLTHSGITYKEVIAPLETEEFLLWPGSYSWKVDYRNGSIVESSTTFNSSTAIIVTGNTIADIAGYSATLLAMTTEINVTVTSTSNQVLTISIDLSNVNSTINNQLIQLLLNVTNTNSTLYSQTVDLLAAIQNTNTTLFSQTVEILADIQNVNSTLYAQTVELLADLSNVNSTIYNQTLTLLAAIQNTNTTLYNQTLTVLADIQNVNSTLYAQAVDILLYVYNTNSTLYAQTISLLAEVDTIEEQAEIIEDVARKTYNDLPSEPPSTQRVTEDIWSLVLKVFAGFVVILVFAIVLATVIRALLNDRRLKAPGGTQQNATNNPVIYSEE